MRPQYRGRGYGTELLRTLAREVKACEGGRLEWSVLKWNRPSIEFYTGSGVGAERMEEVSFPSCWEGEERVSVCWGSGW